MAFAGGVARSASQRCRLLSDESRNDAHAFWLKWRISRDRAMRYGNGRGIGGSSGGFWFQLGGLDRRIEEIVRHEGGFVRNARRYGEGEGGWRANKTTPRRSIGGFWPRALLVVRARGGLRWAMSASVRHSGDFAVTRGGFRPFESRFGLEAGGPLGRFGGLATHDAALVAWFGGLRSYAGEFRVAPGGLGSTLGGFVCAHGRFDGMEPALVDSDPRLMRDKPASSRVESRFGRLESAIAPTDTLFGPDEPAMHVKPSEFAPADSAMLAFSRRSHRA